MAEAKSIATSNVESFSRRTRGKNRWCVVEAQIAHSTDFHFESPIRREVALACLQQRCQLPLHDEAAFQLISVSALKRGSPAANIQHLGMLVAMKSPWGLRWDALAKVCAVALWRIMS